MDEQKCMKTVLLKSAGKTVDLCIIATTELVESIQTELVSRLSEQFKSVVAAVEGDTVFIDEMPIPGPKQAKHCFECLTGVCERHNVRSITVFSDDEPDEFYAEQILAA